MITETDSLKEIKLLERTKNTSNRAALHRTNYKALKLPQNKFRNVNEQQKLKILPFFWTFNPNNFQKRCLLLNEL